MTFADVFTRSVGLSLATTLVLQLTSPPLAAAQPAGPTASDFESARELFRRGKELRAEGQVEAALAKFQAAHTYGQTPITGLELGRTHAQLGHFIEAREVLLSIARIKVAPDESENSAQARREARELADQLRPRLANLTVTVGQAPQTVVTLDGVSIPVIAGAVERVVNPGRHVLNTRIAGGGSKDAELVLAEGESKSLDLVPAPPAGVSTFEAAGSATTTKATGPRSGPGVHPLVYVGFGTALAGVLMGTITGVIAVNKGNAADAACGEATSPICTDGAAQAAAEDAQRGGRTAATVSTVSFVVAGAGAVAGVVGLFLPHGDKQAARSQPSIRPVLGLGYAGLGGSF